MLRNASRLSGMALALLSGLAVTQGPARAAQVHPAAGNDNACVFFHTVYDWKALDDRHLVIWAPGRHDPYEVELAMPLTSLRYADSLAFVDRNGDGQLCGYGMDRIIVPHEPIRAEASIVGMRRLDAAQLAALAEQYNVKLPGVKPAVGANRPVSEETAANDA
jgi:Family of unknown function (DUF6491)